MTLNTSILVTGSSGFVGLNLISYLSKINNLTVYGSSSSTSIKDSKAKHTFTNLKLLSDTNWSNSLTNIDCIVHCAARVHIMSDHNVDPLGEYRKINVEGTLNLAKQAQDAGVKRFIFISSIKVNGEKTNKGNFFSSKNIPEPVDPYGISKMEAENQLMELTKDSSMEVVIIRPCLIYGSGVKGNFRSLFKLVKSRIPLPFRSLKDNKRSFLAIENLLDLIHICINHTEAKNKIFLASDDSDLSTSELLILISESLNIKLRLFNMPIIFIIFFTKLIRKPGIGERLTESLQLDISDTKQILSWQPKISIQEALKNINF